MATTLLSRFSNLRLVHPTVLQKTCSQIHTQPAPLLFHASQQLWAEPMKKKKRIDPSVIAAKEQRKMKRIDKEIKRLTRFGRILKPVEEIEIDQRKLSLAKQRKRPTAVLSFEESEERALLHKEWCAYRTRKWYREYEIYQKMVDAQQTALQELRAESEELYQAAIKIDYGIVPVTFQGPKETPPIKDYDVPDGEYVDTTRKY